MLENTSFNKLDFTYTYSLMGEQQGLLEELLDVVLSPADDAIGTPGIAPKDGRCGKLSVGFDSCQESSPSPPQWG